MPEKNILKQQVVSLFAEVLRSKYLLWKVSCVELLLFGVGELCYFALGETEIDEGWLLLNTFLRDLYNIFFGLLIQLGCGLQLIFLGFDHFFL